MKNILDTNEFHTNQISRRKKKKKVYIYIYIYIYIYGYLINCQNFNNLNGNGDMAGMDIMAGIYTSPYPSPYAIKKVGDSSYPYPCLVNAEIFHQNEDGFE